MEKLKTTSKKTQETTIEKAIEKAVQKALKTIENRPAKEVELKTTHDSEKLRKNKVHSRLISYISKHKESAVVQTLSEYLETVTTFDSLEKFIPDDNKFNSIIISVEFGRENIEKFVTKPRKSDKHFITPVFFENKGAFLFYETPVAIVELKEQIKSIETLYKEIEHHKYTTWENKILSYFYTRPDFTIAPKLDKFHAMFYYFPLVEQFYVGEEDYFYWLEEMANQNIFSKVKLVDRLFCCPYCFSALLKFSDHCPSCGSINIRNEKFIHCFTCGHVAPESNFLKNERFVCPSCKSKLKLIGEDYDRPLENGVCMDCGNYHIDSKLEVSCLTCHKTCTTEDLSKKFIYEYKLTEYGRNQIKFGTLNTADIILNDLNYIDLNHFTFTLNWSIQMQIRYNEESFSLVALKLILDERVSNYDLLLEFSKFLRSIFRTTDFCSKIDNNSFIFLFPKTDSAGLNIIRTRTDEFIKSIKITRGNFDIKIEAFSSTQDNIAEENAQQLVAKLANKL